MKSASRLLLAASLGIAAVVVVARHPDKQELVRSLKSGGSKLAAWAVPVLNELVSARDKTRGRVADGLHAAQEQAGHFIEATEAQIGTTTVELQGRAHDALDKAQKQALTLQEQLQEKSQAAKVHLSAVRDQVKEQVSAVRDSARDLGESLADKARTKDIT